MRHNGVANQAPGFPRKRESIDGGIDNAVIRLDRVLSFGGNSNQRYRRCMFLNAALSAVPFYDTSAVLQLEQHRLEQQQTNTGDQ